MDIECFLQKQTLLSDKNIESILKPLFYLPFTNFLFQGLPPRPHVLSCLETRKYAKKFKAAPASLEKLSDVS